MDSIEGRVFDVGFGESEDVEIEEDDSDTAWGRAKKAAAEKL
jgi:hypothetical protein